MKIEKNDIEILLAKNRSSCSTQIAFKHKITASISEYNPRAISSFVLVGKWSMSQFVLPGSVHDMLNKTQTWLCMKKALLPR